MNGVTEIGSMAFAGSAIETVNAESLKILGSGAFMEALSIKNVPTEQISQFGTMAFAGSSITNVVLRDAEMMDAEVFAYCKNIDTVKIQAECCSFDIANAFFEASYNSIFVSPENANFVSENGFLYSKNKDVLFVYTGSEENVIIAVGVKKISDKAFFGNKSVKKVVFPETLEIIGNDAFAGCDKLETVEFRSVKAPRLLNYAVDGKITYNNFGGKKLNVIHNGDRTFKTVVWASICLDTSWWPYK